MSRRSQGGTPSGAWAPAGAATSRLRAVAMGDSTTAGGLRSVDGTVVQVGNTWAAMDRIGVQQPGNQSWFNQACLLSGGRLLAVYNAGIASDTTVGMLARFAADVLAKTPDVVFLGDAHNDFSVGSGISTATTRANIDSMVRQARVAGIMPILVTNYPENNAGQYGAAIRAHNVWLKQYAAANHLAVVDLYAAVVDPANTSGGWIAANTADGTHASTAGSIVAGQRALADLAGILRGNTTAGGPWLPTDLMGGFGRTLTNATLNNTTTITSSGANFTASDVGRPLSGVGIPAGSGVATVVSGSQITSSLTTLASGTNMTVTLGPHPNLVYNPLFTIDGNADGLADGWTVNGAGVTHTLGTDPAVVGNAQSLVIGSATMTFYQQLSAADGVNVSVGDRLKWSGLAKITAAAGSLNFDMSISFPGVAPYVVKPIGQTVGVDYGWFYYEVEAVVPASSSSLRIGATTYAGTGTVEVAQQSLINMTKSGLT